MARIAHVPVRTCVVCGAKKPKDSLLRMALDTGEMKIVLDMRRCMQGRGAYVCSGCLPRLRFDKRIKKAFRHDARGLSESSFAPARADNGEKRGPCNRQETPSMHYR